VVSGVEAPYGAHRRKERSALRRIGFTTAVLVAVLAFAVTAQAASVNTLIPKDGVTEAVADDASVEYISYGGTGLNDVDSTRIINVDDTIRGAFVISRIGVSGPSNVGLGVTSGVDEWGGAFSIKVVDIVDTLTKTLHPGDAGAPLITDQKWTIVFGADDNFNDWLDSIGGGTDTLGGSMASGTAVRMWEDSTIAGDGSRGNADFLSRVGDGDAGNPDSHVATATDGAYYWDLGFGSYGNTWVLNNSALVAPLLSASLAGSPANFELSLLGSSSIAVSIKHGGVTGLITGDPVDFTGNTTIAGPGSTTTGDTAAIAGFHATDKAHLQFVAVPVPQAVWLGLGMMGLIGFGAIRRRRLA
jgi:hypothetical protein